MPVLSNKAEGASSKESILIDTLELQGMIVRRFAHPQRVKEALSPAGYGLLRYVIELLGKQKVTPDDILFTELVNGYIMEIPRMERSIVFRDFEQSSNVAVRTPTHGICLMINERNYRAGKLGEMLVFDMNEREDSTGMMAAVTGKKNTPQPKTDIQGRIAPTWYIDELYKRSEKEIIAEKDERGRRKEEVIERMKQRFSTARDFMGMTDVGRIRVGGMRINAIGATYGIANPEGVLEDRLLLAAKIYGENDLGVLKAMQIVMRGRVQGAML